MSAMGTIMTINLRKPYMDRYTVVVARNNYGFS